MTDKTAKKTLKALKARWPDEQGLQESDLAGFCERMRSKWGKPLGQLRMLLTMSRSSRESIKCQIKLKLEHIIGQ
jgi:hypothetical protein